MAPVKVQEQISMASKIEAIQLSANPSYRRIMLIGFQAANCGAQLLSCNAGFCGLDCPEAFERSSL
jgi:hypothetical protein